MMVLIPTPPRFIERFFGNVRASTYDCMGYPPGIGSFPLGACEGNSSLVGCVVSVGVSY
jgi:hypothetical protein